MPRYRGLLVLLAVLSPTALALAMDTLEVPWSRSTFEAMEGCRWRDGEGAAAGLAITAHTIGPPAAGQVWEEWLGALRQYRAKVRGHLREVGAQDILITFDGVRAWVRTAGPWAYAADLAPGEEIALEGEAQWVEGNNELCAAFDWCDRVNGAEGSQLGWSAVRATVALPRDADWHPFRLTVTVSAFDREASWARPIFGMDATHDPTRGTVALRNLRLIIPDSGRRRSAWTALRQEHAQPPGLNTALYDRPDLKWVARSFVCGFVFAYDRSFWDPDRARYRVAELLDEAAREFGGYDSVVLWHAYPRVGLDDRNQFDFFADLPGGLAGLRGAVAAFHRRGVRVFIPYNPWDTGTRRPPHSDQEMIARTVAELGADGVFMDTMLQAPGGLRQLQDRYRPGVAFEPEGHPEVAELEQCNASWAQGLQLLPEVGVLHLKWIEPRHMQHQINRWATDHSAELAAAWFNGSGMLVWENIFGSWNPWHARDRAALRRMAPVWRCFADLLSEGEWRPYFPTGTPGVYASCWQGAGRRLWAFVNRSGRDAAEVALAAKGGQMRFYDVWRGVPLRGQAVGAETVLRLRVGAFGGVVGIEAERCPDDLRALLARQRAEARRAVPGDGDDPHLGSLPVVEAAAPPEASPRATAALPGPMLQVAAAPGHIFQVRHQRRECGCYPDPDTPAAECYPRFLAGYPFDGVVEHTVRLSLPAFRVQQHPVTNGQFADFLRSSGCVPRDRTNFLRQWVRGTCPEALRERPVCYVDLDEARAYARWAGLRLPTEWEWQLAAEQLGEGFDRGRVWEWTESERDDGHTRFVMLRGGSSYRAEGSIWYFPGGAQPLATHAKFIRLCPGLDRSAMIGFRCVEPGETRR
jgi:hypothetical protein